MNNYRHLKRDKVLVQLSDGSSICLFCSMKKREFLTELDIKSNILWNNDSSINETVISKDKVFKNFKKLFLKTKSIYESII